MPVLPNPRHEAFAQAIFAGLAGKTRIERAHSTAYLQAYPSCSPGAPAWVNASKLLRRTKVWERVGELQAEQLERLKPKLDLSKETIGQRLRMASEMAEQDRNPQAIVASELGIAKVFHRITDDNEPSKIDFATANSMQDIGRKLLQSVGFASPDDVSIQAAIEANDVFIAQLEGIRDSAQRLTLDQD
jgi:tetrahydromethanopterin S-methyltransferase subunit G